MLSAQAKTIEFENTINSISSILKIDDSAVDGFCSDLAQDEDADSFISSAAYYLFTGRRGLWVYRHYTGAVVPFCWHPNVNGQILVFPSCKKQNDFEAVQTLLSLLPTPPKGVHLARIKEEHLHLLNVTPRMRAPSFFYPIEETELDWRYPAHVVSTEQVMKLEGHDYMLVRNRLRQAYKKTLSVAVFDPSYLEEIKDLVYRWALLHASTHQGIVNLIAPYFALFDLLQQQHLGLKGLVFYVDGQVQAISAWDVSNVKKRAANLFINLCNISFKGLSEFMIQETARFLFEKEQVHYLNLGGSEMATLNRYKKKFMPVYSQKLMTLNVIRRSNLPYQVVTNSERVVTYQATKCAWSTSLNDMKEIIGA